MPHEIFCLPQAVNRTCQELRFLQWTSSLLYQLTLWISQTVYQQRLLLQLLCRTHLPRKRLITISHPATLLLVPLQPASILISKTSNIPNPNPRRSLLPLLIPLLQRYLVQTPYIQPFQIKTPLPSYQSLRSINQIILPRISLQQIPTYVHQVSQKKSTLPSVCLLVWNLRRQW